MTHGRSASDCGQRLDYKSNVSYVCGDSTLLLRILSNFVSNSIKYGQHGRTLVTARFTTAAVVFSVFDQSGGIDSENLSQLMSVNRERLRLDKAKTGVGSGLQICMSLGLQMGAAIDARSTLGRGSVFEVRLPHEQSLPSLVNCAFSSLDLISNACKEELKDRVGIVKLDQHMLPKNIDAIFFRSTDYVNIGDQLRNDTNVMKILVTDDQSIEFKEQWIYRADIFVSPPLNESIIIMAMVRLLNGKEGSGNQ
jgi:hypothetical protein